MRIAFNLIGCDKPEQNNFNNIVAMEIDVTLEFNSNNISSADTNLERRHQPRHLQILSKILIKVAN